MFVILKLRPFLPTIVLWALAMVGFTHTVGTATFNANTATWILQSL